MARVEERQGRWFAVWSENGVEREQDCGNYKQAAETILAGHVARVAISRCTGAPQIKLPAQRLELKLDLPNSQSSVPVALRALVPPKAAQAKTTNTAAPCAAHAMTESVFSKPSTVGDVSAPTAQQSSITDSSKKMSPVVPVETVTSDVAPVSDAPAPTASKTVVPPLPDGVTKMRGMYCIAIDGAVEGYTLLDDALAAKAKYDKVRARQVIAKPRELTPAADIPHEDQLARFRAVTSMIEALTQTLLKEGE